MLRAGRIAWRVERGVLFHQAPTRLYASLVQRGFIPMRLPMRALPALATRIVSKVRWLVFPASLGRSMSPQDLRKVVRAASLAFSRTRVAATSVLWALTAIRAPPNVVLVLWDLPVPLHRLRGWDALIVVQAVTKTKKHRPPASHVRLASI